jgi:hypothetical protein
LERRVLVAADTLAECHRRMDELSDDVLERAAVTHTPGAETLVAPTAVPG